MCISMYISGEYDLQPDVVYRQAMEAFTSQTNSDSQDFTLSPKFFRIF